MKELLKLQLGYTMIVLILIAFFLSPTNKVWSIGIVPIKEQKDHSIQSTLSKNDNTLSSDISDINENVKPKEQKISKKEYKKLLKAQEPNLLPESNLEWFFLLASGVGLFIAILGASIATLGWLIFTGGLITYLFYKLLKN